MHFQEKILIGLSAFLALAGLLVEIAWRCTNGFSRSGSLIVLVGVCFGYLELRRVIGDYEERVNYLESNRLQNDIVFSEKQIDRKERGTTDNVLEQTEHTKEENVRRVMGVEAWIIGLGTLIWGFGDLVLGSPCK